MPFQYWTVADASIDGFLVTGLRNDSVASRVTRSLPEPPVSDFSDTARGAGAASSYVNEKDVALDGPLPGAVCRTSSLLRPV